MIMRGQILLLLLPALSSQCSDFWVSECQFDQDEVILQVPSQVRMVPSRFVRIYAMLSLDALTGSGVGPR